MRKLFPILAAMALVSPASAQAISRQDQAYLGSFDRQYESLAGIRKNPQRYRNAAQTVEWLRKKLAPVSKAGQQHPEFKRRWKQYLDYKALVEAALGGAAKPKQSAAPKLPYADKRQLSDFDRTYAGYRHIAKDPKRYSEASSSVERLSEILERVSAEGRKTDEYAERAAKLDAYRAAIEKALAPAPKAAPAFDEPKPAEQADDVKLVGREKMLHGKFVSELSKHAEQVKAPTAERELDLRCHVLRLGQLRDELAAAISARKQDPGSVHQLRVASWQIERITHALNGALGEVPRAPWGSKERDRLYTIAGKLPSCSVWSKQNRISFQDPAHVKTERAKLDGYRAELDAMKDEVKRSTDWIACEHEYRQARGRFEALVKVSGALAEHAGDVDQDLAAFQKRFPRDSFDPSYQESRDDFDAIRRWARQLKAFQAKVDQVVAFFRKAESLSVKARSQEFRAYAQWFEREVPSRLKAAQRAGEKWGAGDARFFRNTKLEGMTDQGMAKLRGRIAKNLVGARARVAFEEGYRGEVSAEAREQLQLVASLDDRLRKDAASELQNRRLPPAAHDDAELLKLAQEGAVASYGAENVRGVRLTSKPRSYDYDEVVGRSGGTVTIQTTWWETLDVGLAVRKGGKWYLASVRLERRLNSGKRPISEWQLVGEGSYAREIPAANLPAN